ncbi:MAG: hypothetical protein CMO80_00170 [Verrucomicrobiales bacterium]|nr:hypothetical protein [Verrucomicrobiales bacterium]|tara:strand:+ start:11551 stop:12732 length:1182 start_codon:yes stop_codon:yes gene_type:complete
MSWYYADGDEQRGPVSDEEFQQLIDAHKVSGETLVWKEGMADWVAYKTVAGDPSPPDTQGIPATAAVTEVDEPASGGNITCVECNNRFSFDEVIRLGDRYVCAECKPFAVQKMQEGVSFTSKSGMTIDQMLDSDYDNGVMSCIRGGGAVFRAHFFPIIGVSIVVFLVMGAMQVVPFLGALLSLVLSGPIIGGYWLYVIRRVRGEETSIGDAFAGFGPGFGNLMLGYIVSSILAPLPLLPGVVLLLIAGFASANAGEANVALIAMGVILTLVGSLFFIRLAISWFFTCAIIIDKKMKFWPAMSFGRSMVNKHWWSTLGIGFLFGVIIWGVIFVFVIAGGALAAVAGSGGGDSAVAFIMLIVLAPVMLLSIPWGICAYAYRYDVVFGPLESQDEF